MRETIRRFAAAILCALMLTACAAAEGEPVPVGEVDVDLHIFRYTADNGQDIYFVAQETEPYVRYEDVNFDGTDDLVVTTTMGASNFYCEFFVWDGERYVMRYDFREGPELCNYVLYPEKGLVLSSQNDGYAGALFTRALYRWEGAELTLVRGAVSSEYSTFDFSGSIFTTVTDTQKIHVVIRDYTQNEYEGEILYDKVFSTDDVTAELFNEWDEILMSGL